MRGPLWVRERSSRTLDQRLLVRFPRLAVACLRVIGRLPPGSRLRQAALWRAIRLAVEAFNRRDLDAVLVGYHPDFEFHPPREVTEAGFTQPCYRGRTGNKFAAVVTLKHGRVICEQDYMDHPDALAAAGLSE